MINFLLKLLGDPNEKKVKKILGIIDHINALEPELEKLSDEELRGKTAEFKKILDARPKSDNEKADRILEICVTSTFSLLVHISYTTDTSLK